MTVPEKARAFARCALYNPRYQPQEQQQHGGEPPVARTGQHPGVSCFMGGLYMHVCDNILTVKLR